MAIACKIKDMMERSSWIRKMFETGARLKARHGAIIESEIPVCRVSEAGVLADDEVVDRSGAAPVAA